MTPNNNNNTNNNNITPIVGNFDVIDHMSAEIADLKQQVANALEREKVQAIKTAELAMEVTQLNLRLREKDKQIDEKNQQILWFQKQLDKN